MTKLWILIVAFACLVSSCNLFEDKALEPLLSSIDGEEYYNTIEGEMNTQKATLLVLENKTDSIRFETKIDILDSLETDNENWRKRYLLATNIVLSELYTSNEKYVQQAVFSFFIHHPNELINHLNNDGFVNIDTWMDILSKALNDATEPRDITTLSVANAAIKNCLNCTKVKQDLIVTFIKSLEDLTTN